MTRPGMTLAGITMVVTIITDSKWHICRVFFLNAYHDELAPN